MIEYKKELVILSIQLFMFYIFPIFAGPTDAMGMVFFIWISTIILGSLITLLSNKKIKYLYPIIIAIIFIPSVFIYYNESALMHSLWYLISSSIGIFIGIIINLLINKIDRSINYSMKKNKIMIIVILFIVGILSIFMLLKKDNKILMDSISYKGKTYICLEYNMDIFTYYHNSNEYYEEDIIYPISHDKWDMVYLSGDLFVLDSEVEEAKKYYADDNNYEWFIVFDEDDTEIKKTISVNKEELKYIYNMENVEKNETMLFDEIKKFASLAKISKDKMVYSLISLAYYKDSWYWKTEIIDVSKENDPEYVIKLPDSLNKKINQLLNK